LAPVDQSHSHHYLHRHDGQIRFIKYFFNQGTKMKYIIGIITALCATTATAQVTGNVGAVSDYKFRGISQTAGGPAAQGLAEYTHDSGLYIGGAVSSITWVKDATGSGSVETDVYAGYRDKIGVLAVDVGAIGYLYPNQGTLTPGVFANPNTVELYGQVGYDTLTFKYSYVVSSHFVGWYGTTGQDTRGSSYVEANYTYPITDAWSINGHVGYQHVNNLSSASYTDWKVGTAYDTGYGVLGLAYIGTNVDGSCSSSGGTSMYCWSDVNGKYTDVAADRFVASYTYNF
jgi:uncharacterized protein (TIGR02001 family)